MLEPVLAARLRVFAAVAVAVAVATGLVGLLPGVRVYTNGALTAEHVAGGWSLDAFLLVMLAPVLIGCARPTRGAAAWWIAWPPIVSVVGAAVVCVNVTNEVTRATPGIIGEALVDTYTGRQPDVIVHRDLWPEPAIAAGFIALAALFLIVLPLILKLTPRPAPPAARA